MSLDKVTVVSFVALVVAVILHEISHGVVALWFGDDTAKRAGRITLNPVPHIDPVGSIILPALGALAHAPIIGWAKPVPVNPSRLHNSRRDMLFVSLAGPTTNFILAALSALTARLLYTPPTFTTTIFINDLSLPVLFFLEFALVNLFLGIFNFLPIPPLDGASLVERALPEKALPNWYKFRQYGILILFGLVFWTGILDTIFTPFRDHLYSFVLG